MKTKNPAARASANRVRNIKAVGTAVDNLDPTEFLHTTQSELLAVASLMRRCRVSFWHAKTICQLNGLGGLAL